jgi:radical SAM protein with 4Fe4S-binding SPASM domain
MEASAVIKASCISENFPERFKVKIQDQPLLKFIVDRLRQSEILQHIVLATSDDPIDDSLVHAAHKLDVETYRSAYYDSLGRLYGAAKLCKSDIVVKVLGNYPFVDPWETDKLVRQFIESKSSYSMNEHYEGIILGLGVEVVNVELLERVHKEVKKPFLRRLGSNYFPDILKQSEILNIKYPHVRPEYRASLAVPSDVLVVEEIAKKAKSLNYEGIVKCIDDNPILVNYASQNIAGPRETSVEKLVLFPQKIEAYRTQNEKSVDLTYPVSVELSLSNRCNLECIWCSDLELRKKSNKDIDFEVLKDLFKDLSENGTTGVVIEGGGEPTLYNKFNDVIEYIKSLGLSIGLITNGVRMQYEQHLEKFDWIRISLDATDKKQFYEGKKRNLFERVMSNIEKIAVHTNDSSTVLGIGYVLTKDNVDNVEKLTLSLRKLNVDYVQIRPVIDHKDLSVDVDFSYLTKHATSTFAVNIHNLDENVITGNFGLPCRAHSLSAVIDATGDVFVCGRLTKYNWYPPLGNLYNESFYDIWHGQEREKQSLQLLDKDYCRKWCPECRLTKYNVLLDKTLAIKTTNFI